VLAHEEYLRRRNNFPYKTGGGKSIQPWQAYVEEDDIRLEFGGFANRILAIRHIADYVQIRLGPEQSTKLPTHDFVIIHHQNSSCRRVRPNNRKSAPDRPRHAGNLIAVFFDTWRGWALARVRPNGKVATLASDSGAMDEAFASESRHLPTIAAKPERAYTLGVVESLQHFRYWAGFQVLHIGELAVHSPHLGRGIGGARGLRWHLYLNDVVLDRIHHQVTDRVES